MKSLPVERDQIRKQEEIASFGAALLMKHLTGRFEVVGGTKEDRSEPGNGPKCL